MAKVSKQSRYLNDDRYTDWTVDWGETDSFFNLKFTAIISATNSNATFHTEVVVNCNEVTTARQNQFQEAGLGWIGRMLVSEALYDFGEQEDLKVFLEDSFPQIVRATIQDSNCGGEYVVIATCRRLGEDNGQFQQVNISEYLKNIRDYLIATSRKPTKDEHQRLMQILAKPMG